MNFEIITKDSTEVLMRIILNTVRAVLKTRHYSNYNDQKAIATE